MPVRRIPLAQFHEGERDCERKDRGDDHQEYIAPSAVAGNLKILVAEVACMAGIVHAAARLETPAIGPVSKKTSQAALVLAFLSRRNLCRDLFHHGDHGRHAWRWHPHRRCRRQGRAHDSGRNNPCRHLQMDVASNDGACRSGFVFVRGLFAIPDEAKPGL